MFNFSAVRPIKNCEANYDTPSGSVRLPHAMVFISPRVRADKTDETDETNSRAHRAVDLINGSVSILNNGPGWGLNPVGSID